MEWHEIEWRACETYSALRYRRLTCSIFLFAIRSGEMEKPRSGVDIVMAFLVTGFNEDDCGAFMTAWSVVSQWEQYDTGRSCATAPGNMGIVLQTYVGFRDSESNDWNMVVGSSKWRMYCM
jgi:hypothetical protein